MLLCIMAGFYVENSSDVQEINRIPISLSSRSYRGPTVKEKSATAGTKSNSESK